MVNLFDYAWLCIYSEISHAHMLVMLMKVKIVEDSITV